MLDVGSIRIRAPPQTMRQRNRSVTHHPNGRNSLIRRITLHEPCIMIMDRRCGARAQITNVEAARCKVLRLILGHSSRSILQNCQQRLADHGLFRNLNKNMRFEAEECQGQRVWNSPGSIRCKHCYCIVSSNFWITIVCCDTEALPPVTCAMASRLNRVLSCQDI